MGGVGQRVSSVHRKFGGLDSATIVELTETLWARERAGATPEAAAWDVHVEYARRAAVLLAGSDVRAALRAADVSVEALRLSHGYRPREVEGQVEAVGGQMPPAASSAEGPGDGAGHLPG